MRRWSERLMNVVSIQYELPLSSYYFFTDGLGACESVNANCLKKSAPHLSIDDVDCWVDDDVEFEFWGKKKITTHSNELFDDVQ